jgi:hypothetical protein
MADSKYGHLFIKEDKLIKPGHFVESIFSSYDNLEPVDLHCPLNFKKVDKPFIFCVIMTSGKYHTIPIEEPKTAEERAAMEAPPPPA